MPIYISSAIFIQLSTQLRTIDVFSDLSEYGRISETCWRTLKCISRLHLWGEHVPPMHCKQCTLQQRELYS